MKILAAMALATACMTTNATTCSWANPGAARVYPASVEQLLDSYPEMDRATKSKLMTKMKHVKPDDYATIGKETIKGKRANYEALRDMHWRDPNESNPKKQHKVCRGAVDRSGWKESHTEMALVYIETEPSGKRWVVMVPFKCNNVSLASIVEYSGTIPVAPEEPEGDGGKFRLKLEPIWPTLPADTPSDEWIPYEYEEIPGEFLWTPDGYIPPPIGIVYWPDIKPLRPEPTWGEGWKWYVGQSAPIPEPETYAMMLFGLGVIGLVGKLKGEKHAKQKV